MAPRCAVVAACVASLVCLLNMTDGAMMPGMSGGRIIAGQPAHKAPLQKQSLNSLRLRGGSEPPPGGDKPSSSPAAAAAAAASAREDAAASGDAPATAGSGDAPAPASPFNPMVQRMDSDMGMNFKPRMAQTITRSESYSMLDEMGVTDKLRDKTETTKDSKPVNLAGLSGQNEPQPAPKYGKAVAEAWLKAAEEAVSKIAMEQKKEEPAPTPPPPTPPPATPPPASSPQKYSWQSPNTAAALDEQTWQPPSEVADLIEKVTSVAESSAEVFEASPSPLHDEIGMEAPEPPVEDTRLRVVITSSELAPYSKSGGLADVCSKLSVALSQMGHRVMTVSPAYRQYDGAEGTDVRKTFNMYGFGTEIHYLHKFLPTDTTGKNPDMGVDQIFVQSQGCFERAGMYGDPGSHDYFDNLYRFAVLSWASLEAPLVLPTAAPFGEKVVFIANDWQTGLVPLLLTSHYRRWRVFGPARCLFVIHNMGYHGNFPNPLMYNYDLEDPRETPKWHLMDLGLKDDAYYDQYKFIFPPEKRGDGGIVDDGECFKTLLGGIMMADRVVTVSPSYREEICTENGGWGLHHHVLQRNDRLDGILNGIDTDEWNPSTDPYIPAFYSVKDQAGKALCKQKLQEALGLRQEPDAPLVAFIGRLAEQKGIDVIEESYHWLINDVDKSQLIMMGSGQPEYARILGEAEARYKGRICGYVGFSHEMEHQIIAGADILIMPSKYEPCGLPQMYAQRYGTVPIVHATGGLKDSVEQYEGAAEAGMESKGQGWKFGNCDANGLKWGLGSAINIYKKDPAEWIKIRTRGMKMDFGWHGAAQKYVQLMEWAGMDPPRHEPWPFNS